MKVLVTGVNGQLGWEVVRLLRERGVECRGVDVEDFNLTDGPAVKACVQGYEPDVIVHCAAYTAVDKAESEPEICAAVNGDGTLNVFRGDVARPQDLELTTTTGSGITFTYKADAATLQNDFGRLDVQQMLNNSPAQGASEVSLVSVSRGYPVLKNFGR